MGGGDGESRSLPRQPIISYPTRHTYKLAEFEIINSLVLTLTQLQLYQNIDNYDMASMAYCSSYV